MKKLKKNKKQKIEVITPTFKLSIKSTSTNLIFILLLLIGFFYSLFPSEREIKNQPTHYAMERSFLNKTQTVNI